MKVVASKLAGGEKRQGKLARENQASLELRGCEKASQVHEVDKDVRDMELHRYEGQRQQIPWHLQATASDLVCPDTGYLSEK